MPRITAGERSKPRWLTTSEECIGPRRRSHNTWIDAIILLLWVLLRGPIDLFVRRVPPQVRPAHPRLGKCALLRGHFGWFNPLTKLWVKPYIVAYFLQK